MVQERERVLQVRGSRPDNPPQTHTHQFSSAIGRGPFRVIITPFLYWSTPFQLTAQVFDGCLVWIYSNGPINTRKPVSQLKAATIPSSLFAAIAMIFCNNCNHSAAGFCGIFIWPGHLSLPWNAPQPLSTHSGHPFSPPFPSPFPFVLVQFPPGEGTTNISPPGCRGHRRGGGIIYSSGTNLQRSPMASSSSSPSSSPSSSSSSSSSSW